MGKLEKIKRNPKLDRSREQTLLSEDFLSVPLRLPRSLTSTRTTSNPLRLPLPLPLSLRWRLSILFLSDFDEDDMRRPTKIEHPLRPPSSSLMSTWMTPTSTDLCRQPMTTLFQTSSFLSELDIDTLSSIDEEDFHWPLTVQKATLFQNANKDLHSSDPSSGESGHSDLIFMLQTRRDARLWF